MRVLFGSTLVLSALVQLGFGGLLLATPARVLAWGGLDTVGPLVDPLRSVTINLGALIVFCGLASGLAYRWSRRGRREGVLLGVGIGAMLLLMAGLHAAHGIDTPVAFDGIRGLILVGAGVRLLTRSDYSRPRKSRIKPCSDSAARAL